MRIITYMLVATMSKIMALDLGDQWVGIALTDVSRVFARPYKTVSVQELNSFLAKTIVDEQVDLIVVGYPKTMKGGESEQTRKIVAYKEKLEEAFPNVEFLLWDERLSSQRAQTLATRKTREEKLRSHALAAAFILDSYVTYLQARRENLSAAIDKEG